MWEKKMQDGWGRKRQRKQEIWRRKTGVFLYTVFPTQEGPMLGTHRTPNRWGQKRKSPGQIRVKIKHTHTHIQNKEKVLKTTRKKYMSHIKENSSHTIWFLKGNLKARRNWNNELQVLQNHKGQPRLMYLIKLALIVEKEKLPNTTDLGFQL